MLKFVLFLVGCFSLEAQLAPIDNYLGYLGELLEQKQIGDEHLLSMIAGAEQGFVANPITEQEGRINLQLEVARTVLNQIISDCSEHARIIPWATERFSQQEQERREKKRKQEETKRPWKAPKYLKLSVGNAHTCAVQTDGFVRCWGRNKESQIDIPVDLDAVQDLAAGFLHTCAIKADAQVQCWGFNPKGQLNVPEGLRVAVD